MHSTGALLREKLGNIFVAIIDIKYLGIERNFLVVQRMFLPTAPNVISSHIILTGILRTGRFMFKHGWASLHYRFLFCWVYKMVCNQRFHK